MPHGLDAFMLSATIASRRIERALRVLLVLFSLAELLSSLSDLPSLQVPNPTPTTGWLVAGYLSDARTVLAPAIATAAFVFALAGCRARSRRWLCCCSSRHARCLPRLSHF